MKLKAKDNLNDIRDRMVDLVAPDAKVIEFGCGNGDLLLQLSPKIKFGLGIDKSTTAIGHAIRQKERKHISNIGFSCETLGQNFRNPDTYDYSMASLFFHVIPVSDAVYLLNMMREISDTVLICGFSRPETFRQKFLLWLDQRFSGHYGNFKKYQKQGYMEGILAKTQCSAVATYDTHILFLKIYKLSAKRHKKN